MNEDNKNDLKINYRFLLAVFTAILTSAAVAIFFSLKTVTLADQKLAETAEAKRPANLDLVITTAASCKDCFDINSLLNNIKKENVKINSQKTVDQASDEGKQLIERFAIKKLPAFILQGELTKNPVMAKFFSQAGNIINDSFVFRQDNGPYLETATGKIKGRVNLVLLTDIACVECYDVTQHEIILKQFGINTAAKIVDIKSALGKALVKAYVIKLVPAFILTGDVNEYPNLKSAWPQVGIVARDGAYVFTKGVPFMGVHKDLTTNKIITPPSASNQ